VDDKQRHGAAVRLLVTLHSRKPAMLNYREYMPIQERWEVGKERKGKLSARGFHGNDMS
jgi:hypothetical protein